MFGLLRTLLFLMPPERAHHFTMHLLKIFLKVPFAPILFKTTISPSQINGLTFKNKVGLAAGFDKDGKYINELYHLGFGFVEIGTVTPLPQPGNDKPRLFRLKEDNALINRLGFNNEGLDALKIRLEKFNTTHPNNDMRIGINIGKNKITPNELAWEDYLKCYSKLYDLGDFFIVNVSSPNTPNLRELQNKGELLKILQPLLKYRSTQEKSKSLYLKIAPDLSFQQLDEIIDLQKELLFEGIVATNTSLDRTVLSKKGQKMADNVGAGGLSGNPIFSHSTDFIKHIRANSKMTIIGVGGIDSLERGKEKIKSGADLVEIYTGFVYQGPKLIKKLSTI